MSLCGLSLTPAWIARPDQVPRGGVTMAWDNAERLAKALRKDGWAGWATSETSTILPASNRLMRARAG